MIWYTVHSIIYSEQVFYGIYYAPVLGNDNTAVNKTDTTVAPQCGYIWEDKG